MKFKYFVYRRNSRDFIPYCYIDLLIFEELRNMISNAGVYGIEERR